MEKITSIYGCDLRYHSLRIISIIFTLAGVMVQREMEKPGSGDQVEHV